MTTNDDESLWVEQQEAIWSDIDLTIRELRMKFSSNLKGLIPLAVAAASRRKWRCLYVHKFEFTSSERRSAAETAAFP